MYYSTILFVLQMQPGTPAPQNEYICIGSKNRKIINYDMYLKV